MPGVIFSFRSRFSFSSRTRAGKKEVNIGIYIFHQQIGAATTKNGRDGGGNDKKLTKHVVTELRELQAERAELVFGLGAQGVAAGGPEVGDGRAHRRVLLAGVLVDVAGVRDLALGGRVDAVDLAARQALELVHAELLGYRVDARMLEQLLARLVDGRQGGVRLEQALAGQLLGEVVAGVEVLEEAADGVDLVAHELNLSGLVGRNYVSARCAWRDIKG